MLWEDAVSKAPQKFRPVSKLAEAYYMKGKMEKAETFYLKTLTLPVNPYFDDNRFRSANNLGIIYYERGDIKKSKEYFIKAHKYAPNVWETHQALAQFYYKTGDFKTAFSYIKSALNIEARSETYFLLADMQKMMGDLRNSEINTKKGELLQQAGK
ncbi:MAG: tetratricopeptide repeat protein [Nitrospinae bacterium]|nr:tetratricopeptide repeat protein [Nitrospinota bacterium]